MSIEHDETDEKGRSALYLAAKRGDRDGVLRLLALGAADLDEVTNSRKSVLSACARSGDARTLADLVARGAKVNAVDMSRRSVLYHAARKGHVDCMKLLVEHGADLHTTTEDGDTVLHGVVRGCDDARAVEYLLDQGLDVNAVTKGGSSVLDAAAYRGRVECVKVLIERGANIHARTDAHRTVLHAAAAGGIPVKTLEYLLDHGLDINAVDEHGWTPLSVAAWHGHVECAKFLIDRGADVHAIEKDGQTILHAFVHGCDDTRVLEYLLDCGVDVNAKDKDSYTPLYTAISEGHTKCVELLVEHGADTHAITETGRTILHCAADHCDDRTVLEYFLDRGLDVDSLDDDGRTPLHEAALSGHSECVKVLIERGANVHATTKVGMNVLVAAAYGGNALAVSHVLQQGLAINQADNDGNTPLHTAAKYGNVAAVQLLVKNGADIHATNSKGQSPLHFATFGGLLKDGEFLVEQGAEINKTDEKGRTALHIAARRSEINVLRFLVERGGNIHAVTKTNRSVLHYAITRGDSTVVAYVLELGVNTTPQAELVALPERMQLEMQMQPHRYKSDSRLSGQAPLSDASLARGIVHQHEVTFWDFAGQELYQTAHTMFFSRRTLFELVVNLEEYSKQLRLAETKSGRDIELHMTRFVRTSILKWVRTIFAHQPDAQFVVVGTKVNLLEDPALVDDVWEDLKDRVDEWKAEFLKAVQQQIDHKHERGKAVNDLKSKLARFASNDWVVANITSGESIAEIRSALQQAIASNDLGFPMWKTYRAVLQAVLERRGAARRASTARERIEKSIIRFRTLRRQLMNEIEGLERDECEQILRTLNDLGDVLWYEHDSAGVFKDNLILDPMLVIEVVREVVRHDFAANTGTMLSGDGCVSHELLASFPLWRDMDKELMHAFKGLLQHFQLAYPADADSMLPESDLIVPVYWRVERDASTAALTPSKSVCDVFAHRWCWEYEVPGELAETIFEKLAVVSHSSYLKRTIRGFCIEFTRSEFASCISLHLGHSSRDTIRIEVSGETAELTWHNMRFYLMKMEKVLEAYKGDVIWRYINTRENGNETRNAVGALVKTIEDTITMGRDVDALRATTPWMPPDMDWYLHKAWNDITSFQQLQMNELVRNKLLVLEKLAIAGDGPRQFPALWSLEYLPDEHKAIVRMHSDLTGRCYHVPIEIDTGAALLARHASVFKAGLSLCATVVGNALSLSTLQTAVDAVKSALEAHADHATRVHSLIDKLELTTNAPLFDSRASGLSPTGTAILLRDLLKVYNDGLDDLEIPDISNLECAVTSKGEYVWAHAHEIASLNGQVTRCNPPPSTWMEFDRQLEPAPVSPTSTLSMTTGSSTSSAVQKTANGFQLRLSVDAIEGLSDWDWHKTYCKWQLYYDKSRVPIASDVTPVNADSSCAPAWRTMHVSLPSVASVAMLRACRLAVQVKRRSRIGWIKPIGVGEVSLGDVVADQRDDAFQCDAIHVPLDSATRYVVIQLTA